MGILYREKALHTGKISFLKFALNTHVTQKIPQKHDLLKKMDWKSM